MIERMEVGPSTRSVHRPQVICMDRDRHVPKPWCLCDQYLWAHVAESGESGEVQADENRLLRGFGYDVDTYVHTCHFVSFHNLR